MLFQPFTNPFTVNLFARVKSTVWFSDNEFSGDRAVWLKLWWGCWVTFKVSPLSYTHTKGHTMHRHTHTNIYLTLYSSSINDCILPLILDIFVISRIVSSATTKTITSLLRYSQLRWFVCVRICAHERTFARKNKLIKFMKKIKLKGTIWLGCVS